MVLISIVVLRMNCLTINLGDGEEISVELEDELMKLTRENLKLCEEIAAAVEGPSENEPNSLLGSLNILKALRQSSEHDFTSVPPPRTAATTKGSRVGKRKHNAETSSQLSIEDRDSIAADSPATGPSPKVIIPSSNRLKIHASSSRAGSAAPTSAREPSVKIEEGLESGTEQTSKRKSHLQR
jgi:SAGA-associated factor 29